MTIQGIVAEGGLIAPPPFYRAGAVQFGGSTSLDRASALDGLVDAPGGLWSLWLNIASVVAIGGSASIAYQLQSTSFTQPFNLLVLPDSTAGHWQSGFHSTYSGGGLEFDTEADPDTLPVGSWVHVAQSVRTDLGAGLKVRQLLVNGALLSQSGYDGDGSFLIGYGAPTDIIQIGSGCTLGMADLQFWPAARDLSDPAVVACLYAGGKPVDPAIAAAAFGPPAILLQGGASTFSTNAGTGGAFSVTGDPLTDAATGP